MPSTVTLDGHSLSIADVVAVARHAASVTIAPPALASVTASRRAVESAIARGETIYGVNTGFGKLARSEEHTSELQSRGHLVCRLLLEKKKEDALTTLCSCDIEMIAL